MEFAKTKLNKNSIHSISKYINSNFDIIFSIKKTKN